MRWLSSAICTSGEPVSPSVVAYLAMIFFLVSASVPIDMRAPLGSRCAARRGLSTRALGSAADSTAVIRPTPEGSEQPGKAISGPATGVIESDVARLGSTNDHGRRAST